MAERHWRVTYRLPAALEDEWIAALWSAGTSGVQTLDAGEGEVRLEAWFAQPPEVTGPVLDGAAWRARGVHREGAEEVVPKDWLAEWRRQARPQPVGDRFVLDPREPEDVPQDEDEPEAAAREGRRVLLRLPARDAFGTGSHESTRLAVELLEARPPAGETVLDVGTGTGVLAFVALALGAGKVLGFDIDLPAPVQARSNAMLNAGIVPRSRFAVFAGEAGALRAGARFDSALVNVLPGRILDALPGIVARLRPGGSLIFSGIVLDQAERVVAQCRPLGLAPADHRQEGEWIAYRFAKGSSQ